MLWNNIKILAAVLWLMISSPSVAPAPAEGVSSLPVKGESHLAGIYVKDGNANGQLRFLGSGLIGSTSSSSSSTSSSSISNSGINSALNQYITNKQDMLEQLRPTTGTSIGTTSGTGTGTIQVTGTTSPTTGSNVVTTSNGAIYVNLNGGSSSSSSSSASSSATNSAINQAIYGSSPIANLLPQIVAEGALQRRRPAAGGINRRRVQPNRRRRVNKRRGNVNANRRRRGNKNKRGKKKGQAQVMIVRPNRG